MTARGLPHSEILGSSLVCSSPKLIAACYVLHRLECQGIHLCALILLLFLRRKESVPHLSIRHITRNCTHPLRAGRFSCLAHESSSLCSFQGSRCRLPHASPCRHRLKDPATEREGPNPQS